MVAYVQADVVLNGSVIRLISFVRVGEKGDCVVLIDLSFFSCGVVFDVAKSVQKVTKIVDIVDHQAINHVIIVKGYHVALNGRRVVEELSIISGDNLVRVIGHIQDLLQDLLRMLVVLFTVVIVHGAKIGREVLSMRVLTDSDSPSSTVVVSNGDPVSVPWEIVIADVKVGIEMLVIVRGGHVN